ncbi:MAG: translocation/assembly module TamB domain-containing protein, partial [Erythrobacter sp.]|nr:translocation/assembly module TamB domain-containing protein [Erythrobacter sp.]
QQRVEALAQIDIRKGRALVDLEGAFGPEDRIDLRLDARPEDDLFDLALDYRAAADGPIAAIAGLSAAYDARIEGEGTYTRWDGYGLVRRLPARGGEGGAARDEAGEPTRIAAFRIANNAGTYALLGQVSPPTTLEGILGRALGDTVSLAMAGTLEEAVFDGSLAAVSSALNLRGKGVLDLAGNRAEEFQARAILRDPDLLGEVARAEGAQLTAVIDGPFRDLAIDHRLTIDTLAVAGAATLIDAEQEATAVWDGTRLTLPLDISVARVLTGNEFADPRLVGGTLDGTLTYQGNRLATNRTQLRFPGLEAGLVLRGNIAAGRYAIAGPVNARGLAIENVGQVSVNSTILAGFGGEDPWSVRADISGAIRAVANETVANVAGRRIAFRGGVSLGQGRPIALTDMVIDSERLDVRLDSTIADGTTTLAGTGEHVEYGPFTFDAVLDGSGPRAELVLADPLPAAGLVDVRVALEPSEEGFALDVSGGSLLGPFRGDLGIVLPGDGPTRLDIAALTVSNTNVSGDLTLGDSGIRGNLALSGGGLDGTIALAPRAGGAQGFDIDARARNARFGGETPIAIARADVEASGAFADGSSRIIADIDGSGLEYGALSVASFTADAEVVDGSGKITGAIAGRRSDRFVLKFDGNIAPGRYAVVAQGRYGGRRITMPRRAVVTALDGGGYRLAPTQIGFGRGFTILEGQLGGATTALEVQLARMPLRLADLAGADLGLGGRLSGVVTYRQEGNAPPTGNARIKIDDFSRSGLVLSSKPIDVYAVANLAPQRLVLGARLRGETATLGRVDARITQIPSGSGLFARLQRGRLAGELTYDGAAEGLWRLAGIELFDLTGPLQVEARAAGTLADPRISGNLASDDLRLQSAVSGTEVTNISARGRFAGSRLELTRFSGRTDGGGKVSGSGSVDLAGLQAGRGPRIDIRAAADRARLLNANGLDATISGPLRIVSNGMGGTIAGRVEVDRASWSLGIAAEDVRLPQIDTREINRPDQTEAVQSSAASGSWRYLVDARAPSRVSVDGLGLESEWGIDIALRGTVDDPRIGGEANLVRGDYTFAGTRFELTRGEISFDVNQPIDPRLNLAAETTASGTEVTVTITGNAQSPQVAFSSTPTLPEEEILARLLFGGSVTSLSATDALQLGAALASLQGGGGGLDPIGDLRDSIGLDQLRIVAADPVIGRGTGVALGKNLGRNIYVELVTDGQGYSATQLEYRITRWLALLGTVSTIGRDSVLAEISRDY